MNVSADGAVPTASGTSRLLAWTVTWRPSPSTAWRKRISKPTSAQGTTFDDAVFHTRTPVAPILDESLFASAEYARSRQAAAPTSAAAAWRCTPKYRSIRRTLSSFDFKAPSKLHVAGIIRNRAGHRFGLEFLDPLQSPGLRHPSAALGQLSPLSSKS
jgi:hypothetical protein